MVRCCLANATHNDPPQSGENVQELQRLWQQVEQTEGMDAGWYDKAVQYWDKQEASYDGVLGGFGFVSEADVHDSEQLLHKVHQQTARVHDG